MAGKEGCMKHRRIVYVLAGMLAAQSLLLGACQAGAEERSAQTDGIGMPETQKAEDGMGEQGSDAAIPVRNDAQAGEPAEKEEGAKKAGEAAAENNAPIAHKDGANGFALRLTKEMLGQKAAGENLIVSPYSVWLPLAALTNGTDDETKEALLSAIGRADAEESVLNDEVTRMLSALRHDEQAAWSRENGQAFESPLQIANALFVDSNSRLNPEFESVFTESYGGKLFLVDFLDESSVETVNQWAKESTMGKIDRIIDSFSKDTMAAIANAIYFSDGWAKEFPAENTAEDSFYGTMGEESVPFMDQEFEQMPYYEDANMQAATLKTAMGGRLILLLPKEGTDVEALLADMDTETFARLESMEERSVHFSMPRFKIESDVFSLKEALMGMGVPLMDGANPHLDKILEDDALFISQAVQKAMLEVDEKGMTAAAVTAMVMERCSLIVGGEPVKMKCDRPFAFLLTAYAGEEQQILFTGVVNRVGQE